MSTPTALRRVRLRRLWNRWGVLVVSAVALGGSVVTGYQRQAYADCQAEVNDRLVEAIRARGASVDERDAALDAMIDAVLSARTREESRAALENYRRAAAAVREDRARHPLPDPAGSHC